MRGVLVRGRRETGDVSCEDGYWKGSWGTSIPVSIAFPIEGYFLISAAISGVCSISWSVGSARRGSSNVNKVYGICNFANGQFNQGLKRGEILLLI